MSTFLFQSKYISLTTVFINQSEYYVGKTTHLSIYDANNGEQLCIATTNIAGYIPAPGHVLIKDWSENEGVYKSLFKAGVVGPIVRRVPAGFVEAYECELWPNLPDKCPTCRESLADWERELHSEWHWEQKKKIDPVVRDRVLNKLEQEFKE
jgi:hypothetical protein